MFLSYLHKLSVIYLHRNLHLRYKYVTYQYAFIDELKLTRRKPVYEIF